MRGCASFSGAPTKISSMPPQHLPNRSARLLRLALVLAVLVSLAVCAPLALALRMQRDATAHTAVIGGVPAQPGTFPSLAYIVDFQGKIAYQCTGTVIAPNLVLTAGHCAENMQTGAPYSASGYRVVIGAVEPLVPNLPVSRVLGVIVYPRLSRKFDRGDAALLVLSTPTTAPPIALASASTAKRLAVAGAAATMVGWGRTSYEQLTLTEHLQSATTAVQAGKWCNRKAPPFFARSEICTISPPSYTTGVCEGDSGGPLLIAGPSGEPVEVGVADHVYDKCSTHHPSVYASVGALSSWVGSWVAAYQRTPPPPSSAPPTTLPPGTSPQPAPS